MKKLKNSRPVLVYKFVLNTLFIIAFANLSSAMAQSGTLQFTQNSFSLIEGNYDNPVVSLEVIRTGDSAQPITVQYSTNNGTAFGSAACNSNSGGAILFQRPAR